MCARPPMHWESFLLKSLSSLALDSWHHLLLSSVSLMTPRSLYIFFSPCLLTPRTGSQCLLSLLRILRILRGVSKGFQAMHSAKGGDKTLPNSMSTVRMKVEVVKMQLSLSFRHETGRSRGYYILPFLPYSSPLFSALLFFTLRYSTLLFSTFVHSVLLFSILHFLLFSPLFYTSLLYSTLPCSFLLFSAVVCSSVFSSFLHSALLKSPKHDFSPKLPLLTLHMFDFN